MAAGDGRFAALPAAAALLGAVLIQTGTNLGNDYYDFVRGGDAGDRVGPTRVTQAGLLPPAEVHRAMTLSLGLAVVVGAYLVAVGGWPILAVGVASLVCAVAYTGGPWPLAYHGLGDVFAFLFFGPVAVAGTYWVQALEFRPDLLLAGAGVGALITAILVVNNLRDRTSDARAGKRTLAVRLGVTGTRAEYVVLLALGFAAPLLGVALLGWTRGVLLALAAAAAAASPLRAVLGSLEPAALNPALSATARSVGLYGVLLGAGFALGRVG